VLRRAHAGIVIGIATQFFLRRVRIPYTALLLVWGLCIGLLQAAKPQTHAFTNTLSLWMVSARCCTCTRWRRCVLLGAR
jgi:hypothetical protein